MKAVTCTRYGPPEVLQLNEVEKPTPKKHEVCVRIHATAVTTSDSRVRSFNFPLWNPMILMFRLIIGLRKPRQPILGMVLAGEVESVGEKVTRFKPGDAVYGMTGPGFGTYAEYRCLSENSCLVRKPGSISYEDAAAIAYGGLLGSHCLKKGDIQNRKNVLVYGASGAIGTTAVQLAKYYGATVTGVCGTANVDLVTSLGADRVIDYTKEDSLDPDERYDFIFDAVGKDKDSALKRQCKTLLTEGGRYLSVDDGMLKSERESLERINELLESGRFKPVIDKSFSLDDIVEAHRYVDRGHKKGNVVVTL